MFVSRSTQSLRRSMQPLQPEYPERAPGALRRLAAMALATLVTAGCQSVALGPRVDDGPKGTVEFPTATYRRLATDGPVYVLDPTRSSVRIFVYRGGPLAEMGHNHVVAVRDFRGAVFLPGELADARFDLVFPLDALAVDRPGDRAGVAGAFDSRPDEEAIRGTRANMLGNEVLEADRYPRAALHSTSVEGDLPVVTLTLRVRIHGETNELTVPVWIERADQRLVAEGQFRLRQSRFGIEPFSAAAGALRVRDTLSIRFRLVGEQRTRAFTDAAESSGDGIPVSQHNPDKEGVSSQRAGEVYQTRR